MRQRIVVNRRKAKDNNCQQWKSQEVKFKPAKADIQLPSHRKVRQDVCGSDKNSNIMTAEKCEGKGNNCQAWEPPKAEVKIRH